MPDRKTELLEASRLHVVRALPLGRDSRMDRHLNLAPGAQAITWEDHAPRRFGLRMGRRDYAVPISYLIWLIRLFWFGLMRIGRGDTVICMDLDTYLPVRLGAMFNRSEIWFDIVDPIAQARFRNLPWSKVFDRTELWILRRSDRVIVPGPRRVDYYADRLGLSETERAALPAPVVIENVAQFDPSARDASLQARSARGPSDIATVAYFGGLSEGRGLTEMCSHFADLPGFEVLIAGGGPLEARIRALDAAHGNIRYVGAFPYEALPGMMAQVDFYWAYYAPEVLLHHYAYPNKYYEHLAFRVPILMNACVPQSAEVARLGTGIVLEDALTDASWARLETAMGSFDAAVADFEEWERIYAPR